MGTNSNGKSNYKELGSCFVRGKEQLWKTEDRRRKSLRTVQIQDSIPVPRINPACSSYHPHQNPRPQCSNVPFCVTAFAIGGKLVKAQNKIFWPVEIFFFSLFAFFPSYGKKVYVDHQPYLAVYWSKKTRRTAETLVNSTFVFSTASYV